MKKLIVCLLAAILWCGSSSAWAEGMAWRELPIAVKIMVQESPGEVGVTLKPGEYLDLKLAFAAGTGYQWQLQEAPKQLEIVHEATVSEAAPGIVGGPQVQHYIIRATDDMKGSESLVFNLCRSWEKPEQKARTFRLTVEAVE